MKFIPNALTSKIGRQLLVTQKNSPAVLFGAGVIGVVTTTVLACKATLQVETVLDKAQKDLANIDEVIANKTAEKVGMTYSEKDAKKDKAYVYIRTGVALGKLYAPALICGVGSVAALAGAQHILNKRNAALTAAYTTLKRSYDNYRDRVCAEVGREKEADIYRDIQEEEVVDEQTGKKKTVKRVGKDGLSIYARLFDENSTSWSRAPEYNITYLRCQQTYANQLLQSRGHVFLNEIYDALGLPRSAEGAVVGWIKGSKDGDDYIDFGIFDDPVDERIYDFMVGNEGGIWVDFNVDGIIYDKI